MGKSATSLGKELGLTAQEMNQLLKREGYLEGDPGAYSLTPKGEEFAEEDYFHRGPGGYSWYNREWTTTSWDESILDNLDLSTRNLQAAKDAAAEARRSAAAAREALKNDYSSDDITNATEDTDIISDNSDDLLKDVAITIGAGILIGATVYGVKKAAPHVKHWWETKAKPWLDDLFDL